MGLGPSFSFSLLGKRIETAMPTDRMLNTIIRLWVGDISNKPETSNNSFTPMNARITTTASSKKRR